MASTAPDYISETRHPITPRPEGPSRGSILKSAIALAAAIVCYLVMPASMDEPARRMAALFTLALVLWVSEAIPLFATSLLVLALESTWVALPSAGATNWGYEEVFHALSNPVIVLFLGGFILAASVQQERIDVQMAGLLIRAFGSRPATVLAGVMLVTAFFSMWTSNTATTSMMLVLVLPMVRQVPEADPFRRALILSVPFAANIGGISTPIGTPANAIAFAQLAQQGQPIGFLSWMLMAVPLTFCLLAGLWFLLLILFRPQARPIAINVEENFQLTFKAMIVYVTFFVTVIAWITGEWHGIPIAVIALLAAAVLTVTGVVGVKQFNGLDWDILVLIAGGIALGDGMLRSGLNEWVILLMPDQLSWFALGAVLVTITFAMGTLISNTVAVNLLIPLGLALTADTSSEQRAIIIVMIGIAASFGMALPISTPPNALAYATGEVSSRDMLVAGGLIGVGASVLLIVTGPWIISLFI